jgi:cellulose synthase/poly-beta-1,6-N-acetylglucosamine synthase-like glycosyltransferase
MTDTNRNPASHLNDQESPLSVTVVIPAFTMERWALIQKAVESCRTQTIQPAEIVLVVDNCPELLTTATEHWAALAEVRVMENHYREHLLGTQSHQRAHGTARRFGAGSGRNAAVATTTTDVVAFLDDDAWADPWWLEAMMAQFAAPEVVGVTGPPLPDFESSKPDWYPHSFYWVFGCGYAGLPDTVAPAKRIFGGCMAARREALVGVGGFQSVDFDDIDMCMRLLDRYGAESVLHVPNATIHHYVPDARASWRYFVRRTYFVNKEKVEAFQGMGTAANLSAERSFVLNTLRKEVFYGLSRALRRERGALRSVAAMLTGTVLAGVGHIHGRIDARRDHREPSS